MGKRIGRYGKGEANSCMEKDFTEIVCDLGITNITLSTITKTTGGVTFEQDWDKGEKLCTKKGTRKRSTINFKVDLE